jgi:serine/threonine protein kinase
VALLTVESALALSYYREIASLNANHGVSLVQHIESKKIYVKKVMTVFNESVFLYLKEHPVKNTPCIFEVVKEENQLTVIEEYISGDTLEELLQKKGIFSEKQAVDVVSQLCLILQDLHSQTPAIIHRDIKPSNIILSPDGVVKLIDMNAAKWENAQSNRDTVLLGTQGYAAPEQYGFGSSSVQTDIYSVGVLFNELLVGSLPSKQKAGGNYQHIIEQCTAVSPQQRYHSIAALRAALSRKKLGWRRFLPPGFRTLNPFSMLFCSVIYYLLINMALCIGSTEKLSFMQLTFERIVITTAIVFMILFSGNYLEVQKFVPFASSSNWFVRIVAIAIVDMLLLLTAILFICGVEASFSL